MAAKIVSKYTVLDQIEKHNLCKCLECGKEYVFVDVPETSCKQCVENSTNITDDSEEYNRQMKLYNGTCTRGNYMFKPRNFPTNNWIVLAEAGEIEENIYHNMQYSRSRIYLQCKHCNKISLINKTTYLGKRPEEDYFALLGDINAQSAYIIDKMNCKMCNYESIAIQNEVVEKQWAKFKESYNKIQARQQKEQEKLDNYNDSISDIDTKERATNSNESRMKDAITKINPSLDFISAYADGGEKFIKIYCKVCGTPKIIKYNRLNELKGYKCSGCDIKENKDPSYVGLYSVERNIEGTAINYMICIADSGDTLTIKCSACGKIRKDADRKRFIEGKYSCGCEESNILDSCPICGKPIKMLVRDFVRERHNAGDDIKLPCEHTIKASTFMDELETLNRSIETKYILKSVRKNINNFEFSADKTLAISKEIAYYGHRSGKIYRNCRCVKHHQNLVLSEDEIINYDHKMCNSLNNMNIKATIHNLTMNVNGTDILNQSAIDKLRELK